MFSTNKVRFFSTSGVGVLSMPFAVAVVERVSSFNVKYFILIKFKGRR